MTDYFKGKKLYRSPHDAILAGVIAGLAQYLRVDVAVLRLIVVVVTLITHWTPMVIAYIAALILIPIDPAQDTVPATQEPKDVTASSGEEKMDASHNF